MKSKEPGIIFDKNQHSVLFISHVKEQLRDVVRIMEGLSRSRSDSFVSISVTKKKGRIKSTLEKTKIDATFVYISVTKEEDNIREALEKSKIDTSRVFFIDCFSSEKNLEKDRIVIDPSKLDMLLAATSSFIDSIKTRGEKFVVIDSLSSLMLYNSDKDVAEFVKNLIENAAKRGARLAAFTQKSDDKLVPLIYNFFDRVIDLGRPPLPFSGFSS